MSKTISNIETAQYNLVAGGNPLTITATGGVELTGTIAIVGTSTRAWTIANAGTLSGLDGIRLYAGGSVTNTGRITATTSGVVISGGSGTVRNSGTLSGAHDGVDLYSGSSGVVTNLAGGTIAGGSDVSGSNFGVYINDTVGTVTNAGTIIGNAGADAVQFAGSGADRVIVDPGAVFVGAVQGGTVSNTLELAEGSGGTGTLSALTTEFLSFGTIGIDLGAAWSLVNTGTLASGTTLVDSGTLTTAGGLTLAGGAAVTINSTGTLLGTDTVTGAGSLVNHGIILATGAIATYYVFNDGTVGAGALLTDAGTLVNQGSIAASVAIVAGATLDNSGAINLGESGSLAAAGGVAGFGYGIGIGGRLINTGTLGLTGMLELKGGEGGQYSSIAALGAAATNSGTLTNAGTVLVDGGAPGLLSGGTGATLANTGTLTNNVLISLGGGGTYPGGLSGLGALLVDSGALTNAGTIALAGSGAGPRYAASATITGTGTLSGTGRVSGGGSLINHGTILASGSVDVSYLFNDGKIGASALLTDAGTLVNQGSIATDITLASGVTLVNSGTITGITDTSAAVYSAAASPNVTNAGTIAGPARTGIALFDGGAVTNAAGGVIENGAVIQGGAATLIDAGTIIGNTSLAVYFGGNFTDRLIADPGAVVVGVVHGGSGSNTLELAQGSSGNAGTISGIGSQFTGFGTLTVDAGAAWAFDASDTLASGIIIGDAGSMLFSEAAGGTIAVSASLSGSGGVGQSGAGLLLLDGADSFAGGVTLAGGTLELAAGNAAAGHNIAFAGAGTARFDSVPTGTIFGFAATDTIDLPAQTYVPGAFATLETGNTLLVQTGSDIFDLLLDPRQSFADPHFSVQQDSGTGILLEESTACYARGTHLLTARGDIAIETLRIGDQVVTASGALRPIRWIGRRSYDGRSVAGNPDILPICIRAGALADGVPRQDLFISPRHAMCLDNVLIPAELLVNGISIVQCEHAGALTYYHVELDNHDILLAEGAPSESFIDHDTRALFNNAAEFLLLYPVPAPMEDCAPRIEYGESLARVRQRITARAGLGADHAEDAAREGPLDGRIDGLDSREVSGWAFDAMRPHTPVRLEIRDGDRVIGTVLADRFRPDLKSAGKGVGRCAYVFRFDTAPADLRGISVRRSSDGAMLPAPEAIPVAA